MDAEKMKFLYGEGGMEDLTTMHDNRTISIPLMLIPTMWSLSHEHFISSFFMGVIPVVFCSKTFPSLVPNQYYFSHALVVPPAGVPSWQTNSPISLHYTEHNHSNLLLPCYQCIQFL